MPDGLQPTKEQEEVTTPADEALIVDPRAGLTPAQMVERKLLSMLEGQALPVSQVQMAVLPRARGR
jgi:hypothetical protein